MGTREGGRWDEGGREVGRREVGKGGGKKERESERERVMAGKMKWRRGTFFIYQMLTDHRANSEHEHVSLSMAS